VLAHVVGKPEKEFFLLAKAELGPGLGTEEILMVGDDVRLVGGGGSNVLDQLF
jgi:ribonucleotide monophosphatase NagD (HAD superfamily)